MIRCGGRRTISILVLVSSMATVASCDDGSGVAAGSPPPISFGGSFGFDQPAPEAETEAGAPGTETTDVAEPTVAPTAGPTTVPGPPMTSCTSVVHIGDSTSVGLISPSYLADPAQRVDAQYLRVGVTDPRMEISGARSTVETVGDQVNARDTAAAVKATGYEGCWVLALGTTDTANVAVAPTGPSRAERIDRMMAVTGDDPVLWVDVRTLVADGAWSDANMQLWNAALVEATTRYPQLRVYDWASVVDPTWFADDQIHYTSQGYAERARLIADALAAAFPA